MNLNNINIKTKLLSLALIPMIVIAVLSSISILEEYEKEKEYEKIKELITLNAKISLLIHETQIERGVTAGFLGSDGDEFEKELITQRKKTNIQRSSINTYLKDFDKSILKNNAPILKDAMKRLSKIEYMRTEVNDFISTSEATAYYSDMNDVFLNLIIQTARLTQDSTISKNIISYANFLKSKEIAGIERDIVTNTLTNDKFEKGIKKKIDVLVSTQSLYLSSFLDLANKDTSSFYNKTVTGKDVDEVNSIRRSLSNASAKHIIVSRMKDILGYGGIIHNFKNYVIRGTPVLEVGVVQQYFRLTTLISKYEGIGSISKKEKELLKNIDDIFAKYKDVLPSITEGIANKTEVKKLDKLLEIDDEPAIKAIKTLSTSLFSNTAQYWFTTITKKINLLKQTDDYLSNELMKQTISKVNAAEESFYSYLIINIFIIICLILLVYLIFKNLYGSIQKIHKGIEEFMHYLSREINILPTIDLKGKDELCQIASMANINIKKINDELEQDMLGAGESVLVLSKMAQGHFDARVSSTVSNPQIQTFINTLNKTLDTQSKLFDNILTTLKEYSNYNYLKTIDGGEIKGELKELIDGINSLSSSITTMLGENKSNGLSLQNSSNILVENMDTLSTTSNETAASLEETAAALEEITSTIINSSDNISRVSQYSSEVLSSTSEGEKLAQETTSSMDEINNQVVAIRDAISVIDQISFQTNILSLNAAVEAATAGESGKGFAVVAQEVRNLASRSAEAAKEIKGLVENATSKASQGKKISSKMIEGYLGLNKNVSKTAELISLIQTSSKEQQSGVEQINSAINNLDKQTQQNASIASQTASIASQTDEIAKLIVSEADAKEFAGKDSIQERGSNLEDKKIENNISSNVKSVKSESYKKSTTDEWESF